MSAAPKQGYIDRRVKAFERLGKLLGGDELVDPHRDADPGQHAFLERVRTYEFLASQFESINLRIAALESAKGGGSPAGTKKAKVK